MALPNSENEQSTSLSNHEHSSVSHSRVDSQKSPEIVKEAFSPFGSSGTVVFLPFGLVNSGFRHDESFVHFQLLNFLRKPLSNTSETPLQQDVFMLPPCFE